MNEWLGGGDRGLWVRIFLSSPSVAPVLVSSSCRGGKKEPKNKPNILVSQGFYLKDKFLIWGEQRNVQSQSRGVSRHAAATGFNVLGDT